MKILAIDDNADNLILLKATLEDAFPESIFYSALDGPKGIELAIANDPDVILLDILMPVMNGYEVCRHLKKDERVNEIPVIFLTAIKEDKETRIKALDAGGEAFLFKPIDEIELTAQVRAMAKIRQASDQKRTEQERLARLVAERTRELEQSQIETFKLLEELQSENESRKGIEEELRESEAKYRTLFTQMNEGFAFQEVVYDANHAAIDYRILDINTAFERQIGILAEKAKGTKATELYGVSSAPYLDIYVSVAETGKSQFFETYFPPLEKHFEISVFSPNPGYFATIFTDITERKRIGKVLQESEEKYRILFNSSPDANLIIIDGIFVDCNRATEIMMGGDRLQIIGHSPEELSPEFQPDGQESSVKAAVLIGNAFLTGQSLFEWVHCRLDGSEFTLEVIIVPMVFEGKKALHTTWRDITERKKTEEALKENEARLREAVATKDKFFSIIAHDLKNPFNSIVGFSDLLVEQVSEKNYDSIGEYSTIIQNSSQRVMDLLTNLLEWSRSQTGRMEYNPEFIDMVILLNQVRELLDDSAHQKAISIELKTPRNGPVIADKAMILTVLRNLVSNAVKFTSPGGAIIISLVQNQKELMVSVADNGLGIKKELIGKLFKIEESQSTPGTNNERGTGLGLILCKEFVEKHGGKIWVESEPGKGSTFHFSIPKNKDQ